MGSDVPPIVYVQVRKGPLEPVTSLPSSWPNQPRNGADTPLCNRLGWEQGAEVMGLSGLLKGDYNTLQPITGEDDK